MTLRAVPASASSSTSPQAAPWSALIDFSDPQHTLGHADAPRLRHAFGAPLRCLAAYQLQDVLPTLAAVQAAAESGLWCVGYVRYEAAPAMDTAFTVNSAADTTTQPLVWFGLHEQALPWPTAAEWAEQLGYTAEPDVQWQSSTTPAVFAAAMDTMHEQIADGVYYQVNYTAPVLGRLSPLANQDTDSSTAHQRALTWFAALQRAQPGGYGAFLQAAGEHVLSASPELFFDWRGHQLLTRPMKGTAPRGATPEQDDALAEQLKSSIKERAENVMIVDLLRNDVSRIAEPFSVKVPQLFHTQALPTVWQMTSDVTAQTRAGTTLADVFAALFPCGSITGAPKVSAMRAIAELESSPRGIYCGALGVVQPGGAATFNVPIRTITLQGDQAVCGIGSGITASAETAAEWQEWQHKQAFLERSRQPFDILETLALDQGQLRNVSAHLARMQAAAHHFAHPFDLQAATACLNTLIQQHPSGLWRVRLLLNGQGRFSAQAFAAEPSPAHIQLQLAKRPLAEAHSEFVRFKTSRRAHYDAFTPSQAGVFDTVLYNTAGEITECTRGNLAVLIDGRWLTPALACGLLPGVGRALALQQGRIEEAVITLQDLPRIKAWAFLNSLRGWIDADLLPTR